MTPGFIFFKAFQLKILMTSQTKLTCSWLSWTLGMVRFAWGRSLQDQQKQKTKHDCWTRQTVRSNSKITLKALAEAGILPSNFSYWQIFIPWLYKADKIVGGINVINGNLSIYGSSSQISPLGPLCYCLIVSALKEGVSMLKVCKK